jgi:hypothetical protein
MLGVPGLITALPVVLMTGGATVRLSIVVVPVGPVVTPAVGATPVVGVTPVVPVLFTVLAGTVVVPVELLLFGESAVPVEAVPVDPVAAAFGATVVPERAAVPPELTAVGPPNEILVPVTKASAPRRAVNCLMFIMCLLFLIFSRVSAFLISLGHAVAHDRHESLKSAVFEVIRATSHFEATQFAKFGKLPAAECDDDRPTNDCGTGRAAATLNP